MTRPISVSRICAASLLAFILTSIGCTEEGSDGGPCYGNGTCNEGLECIEGNCVDGTAVAETRLQVFPAASALAVGRTLELRAMITDANGNLVVSTDDSPVVVDWSSSNEAAATVDASGVVRALTTAPATITAQIRGTGTTGSVAINLNAAFTDVQSIQVQPSRLAIDVGETRTVNLSAVDFSGSPTSLDCDDSFSFDARNEHFAIRYIDTLGAEQLEFEGLDKGFEVVTMNCAGLHASPVIVEVKPAVVIPPPQLGGSNFGHEVTFALDGPTIHMASRDAQSNKLVYTRFDGVWTSTALDGSGRYGGSPHVILDPLNGRRPLIVAKTETGLAAWKLESSGFWTSSPAMPLDGSLASTEVAAVVDASGKVHVFAAHEGTLTYGHSVAASRDDWVVEPIPFLDERRDISHAAVAVAADGRVRAAFVSSEGAFYAVPRETETGWNVESIDGDTQQKEHIALAVGEHNRPHVVYLKNGSIMHAVRSGGSWLREVVETADVSERRFGLGLDRHGQPRVSYFDEDERRLVYAYKTGDGSSPWRFDTPETKEGVGQDTYLVVDEFGRAQIAYYDPGNRRPQLYVEPHFLDYSDIANDPVEPASNTLVARCDDQCAYYETCIWSGAGVDCRGSAECGNGIQDPGEACDDANTNPDDGCDPQCQVETCWDGTPVEVGKACPYDADDDSDTTDCRTNAGCATIQAANPNRRYECAEGHCQLAN